MNFERILVLSPHPDDVCLGAAGTIARFLEEGKEIYDIVFSGCEESIPDGFPKDTRRTESKNATQILGIPFDNLVLLDYPLRAFPIHRQQILEDLLEFNEKLKPDLVLVPSSNDLHQDHQTIYSEALRAFKKTSSIWGYEHPWNNLTFTTDIFVRLEERHVKKKIKALNQHLSQNFRTYMRKQSVRALARSRGAQIDLPYAEAFELIRLLL